jgi:hypothetical protein
MLCAVGGMADRCQQRTKARGALHRGETLPKTPMMNEMVVQRGKEVPGLRSCLVRARNVASIVGMDRIMQGS